MSSRLTAWVAAALFGAVLSCPGLAQENTGIVKQPPIEETESPVEKIDSARIVSDLAIPLKLSSRQEERLRSALEEVEKKIGKLEKEHQSAREEAGKWRYQINDLRYEMLNLAKTIPDVIRPLLDPEQREKFDSREESQAAKKKEQQVSQEPLPTEPAPGAVVKKKRRIKKVVSEPPAGQEPTAAPVQETPAGEQSVQEAQPPVQPVRKKKKVKKRVIAQPQSEAAAVQGFEPAGQPAPVKEETAEEVPSGSYP